MCYPLPGPRCSTHEKAELEKAKVKYNDANVKLEEAKKEYEESGSEEARTRMNEASKERRGALTKLGEKKLKLMDAVEKQYKAKLALDEAKVNWQKTPKGIEDLRNRGEDELADKYTADRKQAIENLKTKIANEKNAPLDGESKAALDELKSKRKVSEKEVIAKSSKVSAVHKKILSSKDSRLRESLAVNPNINEDIQSELAMDEISSVRAGLARNGSVTDVNLLHNLAKSRSAEVRAGVAGNKNADPRTLAALGNLNPTVSIKGDDLLSIRSSVASNPSTHPATLTRMLSKGNGNFGYDNEKENKKALDAVAVAVIHNKSSSTTALMRAADILGVKS